MGYLCDFCGQQRSVVYCRSDAASLCLSCDCNVHSANALSRRHTRTLVCERCNSEPALVRCTEERISLCANCDWIAHSNSSTGFGHKRQAVHCYSGCPSVAELSTSWPFLLDFPSVGDSTCEQGMGSMSISDTHRTTQHDQGKSSIQGGLGATEVGELHKMDKSTVWMQSSVPMNVQQPTGYARTPPPKVSGTKGPSLYDDDGFYEDFIFDEVDLSIENYEEFFGGGLNNPEQLFANDEIGDLFRTKDMSAADSNCQSAHLVEEPWGQVNSVEPACSNAPSAESMMSSKTEPNLCFTMQGHSSLSFSGLTVESSAGDYQDCGASSMLLMGEPPWCQPGPESSMPSTSSRTDAVMRYKEKKKARKFDKKVRYASRKARADVRRRVKGRFVKAGDAYDYDPLSQTRSC